VSERRDEGRGLGGEGGMGVGAGGGSGMAGGERLGGGLEKPTRKIHFRPRGKGSPITSVVKKTL